MEEGNAGDHCLEPRSDNVMIALCNCYLVLVALWPLHLLHILSAMSAPNLAGSVTSFVTAVTVSWVPCLTILQFREHNHALLYTKPLTIQAAPFTIAAGHCLMPGRLFICHLYHVALQLLLN